MRALYKIKHEKGIISGLQKGDAMKYIKQFMRESDKPIIIEKITQNAQS